MSTATAPNDAVASLNGHATAVVIETPPDPRVEEAVRFLNGLFEPMDIISFRSIESWTENGRKRSLVDYKGIRHDFAAVAAAAVSGLLRRAEAYPWNIYFGVCPRVGAKGYDRAFQIRTGRCVWSDVDGASIDEILERITKRDCPNRLSS